MRLAILASHPVQYYAPLFREIAHRIDLHAFYAFKPDAVQQGALGFGAPFEWDVDLASGYRHSFLRNRAAKPGTDQFFGCDTPEIGRHLREGRFSAVLVLGWHLKSYMQGVLAAKSLGLPVLVRGDSQLNTPRSKGKELVKKVLYPPLLRLFDAALFVGQRSKGYYEHFAFPAERLFFSPHCIDTNWFATRATLEARANLRAQLMISDTTTLVLFAGKLVDFKRPLDVLAAIATLRRKDQDVQLLVAGEGELKTQLKDQAAASGVPAHLLGFCNQSQMPSVYAACDTLALPSDGAETWGLVANEALACGRPIIVSDACGCAPDLANDGFAGRAFRAGDIDGLAAAIEEVAGNPPPPKHITRLSDRFTLERAADGVEAALSFVSAK